MPATPLIDIRNLCADYGGRTVLRDVNLQVGRHDFLGIIGPNGGGKTTLVRCMLGLLKPRSGEIAYCSARDTEGDGGTTRKITMGYLPQYNRIDRKFPISVREVVLSGLSCRKSLLARFAPFHREKVNQVIAQIGLEGLADRPFGSLSGGQRQRALLGRAIVSDPEVVILDEPSTYIDQRYEARLWELLTEINRQCAVVLVSHDIGTILQQVKQVACVNETLDYHPSTECVTGEWLETHFDCPIELLGHGNLPHRILGHHRHG